MRSISAAASGARLAVEPGPEQGVDDDVGIAVELFGRLTPRFREHAQRDPPVAAVCALAAHRCDPARVGIAAKDGVCNGTARAFHHFLDVVALLGGAHLVRRVERLEHQLLVDDGHRVGEFARVRHRQVDRTGAHLLRPGRDPAAETHGRLRPAGDLDVAPGERARNAEAERLAHGLFAGEPAGVALGGIRTRVAVRTFRIGEAPLPEARIARQRTAHALDLDQVDADGRHK